LGAEKKIELVIVLLARLGFTVHLVDSSHAELGWSAPVGGEHRLVEGRRVGYWRPFSLPSRKLGKLANVYLSFGLFARVAALRPELVWLYNSYAFEARLGLHLQRRVGSRLVLELEDLPRARGRGLNPKPLLDQAYFATLLRRADVVTFVNSALRERLSRRVRGAALSFPSIVKRGLGEKGREPPFAGSSPRLGYFGGLEPDKGVAVLLELLPMLPDPWRITVTGVGTLEAAFREAAAQFPAKLEFHGRVAHERVTELMRECDAIVNPHTSIAQMRDGVFPFKVCESIASGALTISTALPPIDVDLSRAVLFYDGSVAGLAGALSRAREWYETRRDDLRLVRDAVRERYGEDAVLREIAAALGTMSISDAARARSPTEASRL
jgi:glycosyltransferase involved in cell wall biosynthesis